MNLKCPCIKHAVLYISPIVNKHQIHLTRAKQKKSAILSSFTNPRVKLKLLDFFSGTQNDILAYCS